MRRESACVRTALGLVAAAVLTACGSRPPAPEWQMNAKGAMERYTQAWLTGADRAADAEFARARAALASTGRSDLVARAELVRCALQVASLASPTPPVNAQGAAGGAGVVCEGFEALRADAAAPEKAYAAYLAGVALPAADAALLPPAHRVIAAGVSGAGTADLSRIEDPLSRLVAAGVLVRSGRGTPEVLRVAAETDSQQGWRRPLLAWLGAQARLAEQGGRSEEAQALRRRMALVAGEK